jgi:hypothetical protein
MEQKSIIIQIIQDDRTSLHVYKTLASGSSGR